MSFILDALKKSDSDRQKKGTADTAFVSVGSGDSQSSRWLWIVGVLLLVNVVVLLIFLLQTDAIEQPQTDAMNIETADENTVASEPVTDDQSFRELVAEAKRTPTEQPPMERMPVAAETAETAETARPIVKQEAPVVMPAPA